MKYSLLFILSLILFNCLSTDYKTQSTTKLNYPHINKDVNLMISYNYLSDDKILDVPLSLVSYIPSLTALDELIFIRESFTRKGNFKSIELNSNKQNLDLNVKVTFKNSTNILAIFVTALTIYIIPHYYDVDLELEAIIKDEAKRKETKFYSQKSKSKLWFGWFPAIIGVFNSPAAERKEMINSMVINLLNELSKDEVVK
ncbi:MAG: hypothetical protein KBF99_06460 [Leptospiraceae bacterium]|nr:hypothetical protein [Leptospiraceae bacterium]MBP9162804.1 hypothetical protein [Leptospiraceae bacterium]